MNKHIRGALCVLLCLLCAALPAGLPAYAEQNTAAEETSAPEQTAVLKIYSVADFLEFAEACRLDSYSLGLTVSLEADLDLSGRVFESVPIFCGTFRGNGHTVRGVELTGAGSVQGLFRYLWKAASRPKARRPR